MAVPSHEWFSGITHMVGAALAVVGLVALVVMAEGFVAVTAFAVYGATLTLMYLTSTLYHLIPAGPRGKAVLRRLDHTGIYLVIAGSYTPPALVLFPGRLGWAIFGVVWALALGGIILKWVGPGTPKWVTAGLYVLLGWLAVVGVKPLVEAVPLEGLFWLFAGGVAYTVGAVLYATRFIDPWPRVVGAHGVWHLFVLAGSSLHFVFMAAYVL